MSVHRLLSNAKYPKQQRIHVCSNIEGQADTTHPSMGIRGLSLEADVVIQFNLSDFCD